MPGERDRQPRRRAARWLAATVLAGVVASPALATHVPDHRFVVLGYVTDEARRPLAATTVVVTRLKTGLRHETRTERDGFYLVVLHLHDEDLGDRLRIRASGVEGEVAVRFDVRDKKIERGTRVDIQGSTLTESAQAFAETLRAYLAR
jgi:hypothetical protein